MGERETVVITLKFAAEHSLPAEFILILLLEIKNQERTFCFSFGSSTVCMNSYFLNDTHQLSSFNISTSTPFLHNACTYAHSAALGIHSEI